MLNYQVINYFHILIVGPLLTYIGYNTTNNDSKIYDLLFLLSLLIFILVRSPGLKLNYRNTINIIHYLMWPTFFIWISYQQNDLPNYMFEIIKYLGISVIAIHYYFLQKSKNL
jgi:hypothetical protein